MMDIKTTKIYDILSKGIADGYTTISAQGSSRSGKTYNILIFLIVYLLQHPATKLTIVRGPLPALKGSVLVDFKEILLSLDLWEEKSFNKSEMVYMLPNGSSVDFISTDSEQKLRGRKRDVLFVNEANELLEIEWEQLKMRTTRFSIVDYNPSFSDDHWLCSLNKEEKTLHFITTFRDNPFLPDIIRDNLLSLKDKNPALWRIYGLGLQALVEGLVFPKYEVVDRMPEGIRHLRMGLDFGFTNDPTAGILVGFSDDALYLDEVIYQAGLFAGDIASIIKQEAPRVKVIADSAEPRTIADIGRHGIDIHPVTKGKDSVSAGITKMQTMRIFVTKRSSNLIKELRNYTYRQTHEGKWLNEPIDAFNHALDAVRYVVLSEILDHRPKARINKRKLASMAY